MSVSNQNIRSESLLKLGGKKKDNSIYFLSSGLLIRDIETRHEYTVEEISFTNQGKPFIKCYRYYGPNSDKKAYLVLDEADFDSYEPV